MAVVGPKALQGLSTMCQTKEISSKVWPKWAKKAFELHRYMIIGFFALKVKKGNLMTVWDRYVPW